MKKQKEEGKYIHASFIAIKAVLLDAEEQQANDHRLSIWLGELKEVLKDAENVLDEFQYLLPQKEVMKRHGSTSKKGSVQDSRAMLPPGPPQSFALQKVQEVIKPQVIDT
nr:hypothetical protein CFP56_14482 [Quercus suber]